MPEQRNSSKASKHIVTDPTRIWRPKFRQSLPLLVPAYLLGSH
jgi:hypothetical protein